MIYSHEHKIVFLAVPKTGSRSIWFALREHYGARIYEAYHSMAIPHEFKDYFRFAAVRNPYARMVSFWDYIKFKKRNIHHEVVKRMSFGDFVHWATEKKREGILPQSHYIEQVAIGLDALLRTESLSKDWQDLPFYKGIDIGNENKGRYGGNWCKFYTPKLMEVIREWAKSDFTLYGY